MNIHKSRLEFKLSIARKEPLEDIWQKWNQYMLDYDALPDKTIGDKIHMQEAFYMYFNYLNRLRNKK